MDIKKSIKQIFTEPDNETLCPVRTLAIAGFLYGFVTHCYTTFWLKAPFDWMVFWQGFGLGLGALGVALGVKKDSKKDDPNA